MMCENHDSTCSQSDGLDQTFITKIHRNLRVPPQFHPQNKALLGGFLRDHFPGGWVALGGGKGPLGIPMKNGCCLTLFEMADDVRATRHLVNLVLKWLLHAFTR